MVNRQSKRHRTRILGLRSRARGRRVAAGAGEHGLMSEPRGSQLGIHAAGDLNRLVTWLLSLGQFYGDIAAMYRVLSRAANPSAPQSERQWAHLRPPRL